MKYIVGNILSLKDDIVKIIAVGFGYYTVRSSQDGDINYIDEKDLKPINITKEALLNNGWEEIAQGYYKSKESTFLDIYYLINGKWQLMFKHKPIIEISYIHELQHFLFGMQMNYLLDYE